jgi:hypothetical protein
VKAEGTEEFCLTEPMFAKIIKQQWQMNEHVYGALVE